jgi:uncharacterized protein
MAEFVIPVPDLKEAGKDYTFRLEPHWLASALEGTPLSPDPTQPVTTFEVHAQRNGNEVLVDGPLHLQLRVECCRCLEPFPLEVDTRLTALFSPEQDLHDADGPMELTAEDLDRAVFDGHEVILDDLVREQLVLECPMQPVCSPDCQGISIPEHLRPKASDFERPAVDPRLAPLMRFKDKLPKKE